MADLGFVGLGVMGGNMVARLLEKGHTVTGYNRTRTKAQWLIDKGMKWADMPRSMCRSGRYVFHGDQYRGAASHRGRSGWHARRAGQGKTLIEMSTVSPEFSSARGVSAHFMP